MVKSLHEKNCGCIGFLSVSPVGEHVLFAMITTIYKNILKMMQKYALVEELTFKIKCICIEDMT